MTSLILKYFKKVWLDSAYLNNDILSSYVEPAKEAKILDIGCDNGEILIDRVKGKISNPKIYGLDIDPGKVKKSKKLGVIAQRANVENRFPYKDNNFDLVSANQIIEHLLNVDGFLQEINRVLRPGGYLVLSTENLSSWHNLFALALGWQAFSQHISKIKNVGNPMRGAKYTDYELSGMHIKIFTPRGLKELVKLHGFKIEHFFGAGYYPFSSQPSRLLSRVDPTHAAFIGLKARKVK